MQLARILPGAPDAQAQRLGACHARGQSCALYSNRLPPAGGLSRRGPSSSRPPASAHSAPSRDPGSRPFQEYFLLSTGYSSRVARSRDRFRRAAGRPRPSALRRRAAARSSARRPVDPCGDGLRQGDQGRRFEFSRAGAKTSRATEARERFESAEVAGPGCNEPLCDGETAFSEGLNLDITENYVDELRQRLNNRSQTETRTGGKVAAFGA